MNYVLCAPHKSKFSIGILAKLKNVTTESSYFEFSCYAIFLLKNYKLRENKQLER
jgi:hypothetical protein